MINCRDQKRCAEILKYRYVYGREVGDILHQIWMWYIVYAFELVNKHNRFSYFGPSRRWAGSVRHFHIRIAFSPFVTCFCASSARCRAVDSRGDCMCNSSPTVIQGTDRLAKCLWCITALQWRTQTDSRTGGIRTLLAPSAPPSPLGFPPGYHTTT